MEIKLVIGLGNPGTAYEKTRHNAGAWFVEALAAANQAVFRQEKKIQAAVADCSIGDRSCKLMIPDSFINNSGLAVKAACKFYHLEVENILIVHDDLDLANGLARLKISKGHGGHNGLRDILQNLSNQPFLRLRFGIGHPGHKDLVHNYVLGKPSPEEKKQICEAIERSIAVVPLILAGNSQQAMNILHS